MYKFTLWMHIQIYFIEEDQELLCMRTYSCTDLLHWLTFGGDRT